MKIQDFFRNLTSTQKLLIIIRCCKAGDNEQRLNRAVSLFYGYDVKDKLTVNRLLTRIIDDYDLLKGEYKDWKEFFLDVDPDKMKWITKESKPWQDAVRDDLVRIIRHSETSKFGEYPEPACYRNWVKRRENTEKLAEKADPPLEPVDRDEVISFFKSLQDGERVIELGESGLFGHMGTVYHDKTGTTCVRWDAKKGEGQMGSSITWGCRRFTGWE